MMKNQKKKIAQYIEELDREKNMIESAPIFSELSKVEMIIKNDKIEEKYNEWKERFEKIKEEYIDKINVSVNFFALAISISVLVIFN